MVELLKVNLVHAFGLIFLMILPIKVLAVDPLLTAKTSVQQAWQRQQVIVSMDVQTDDPFARLQVDNFKQQGLSIEEITVPLTTPVTDSQNYILSKKWVVYPLDSGNHTLKLPRVRYIPNRGSIKTLTTPHLSLHVQALPMYIPPTMPVGKIELESQWDNGFVITTKKIFNWQIKMYGIGVDQQTMPPILRKVLRKVAISKSLTVLPAKTSREVKTNDQVIGHLFTYAIPVKTRQNGRLDLPDITVQYFDPRLGKLNKIQLKPPFVIALNAIFLWIIGLMLVAGLVSGLLVISQKIKTHLNIFAQKRNALRLLEQASSYRQVRSALNKLATLLGLGTNLTLTEFTDAWKNHYSKKNTNELEEAMQALHAFEFGYHQQDNKGRVTKIAKTLSRILQ